MRQYEYNLPAEPFSTIELWHRKTNKMTVRPAKTPISLGIRPVFSARKKNAWVISYPMSAHLRLIRLGRCPGWSESLLEAHSFCWFCHVAAQLYNTALTTTTQLIKFTTSLTTKQSFNKHIIPPTQISLEHGTELCLKSQGEGTPSFLCYIRQTCLLTTLYQTQC